MSEVNRTTRGVLAVGTARWTGGAGTSRTGGGRGSSVGSSKTTTVPLADPFEAARPGPLRGPRVGREGEVRA